MTLLLVKSVKALRLTECKKIVPLIRLRLYCLITLEGFSSLATSIKSDVDKTCLIKFLFSPFALTQAGEKFLSTSIYILTEVAKKRAICLLLISDLIKKDCDRLCLAKVEQASSMGVLDDMKV